jgi:hypothetical protein
VPRAKWNEPLVEVDPNFVEMTPDGPREGLRVAFCAEDIEMFRQGYKCIECWEPLESAFPETCPMEWCGFPIRAEQSATFAERFSGSRAVESQINADEELERLARQKDERDRREGLKAKGIVIPRNVKL